jgi:hypothetical protein
MDEWRESIPGGAVKGKIIFPQLSYRVMQAVFEVPSTLGPGFAE